MNHMNWLIIAPEVKNTNLKEIENLLYDKGIENPCEIFLDTDKSNEEIYETYRTVMRATHCVVLDAGKMSLKPEYIFISGMLSGNRCQTFVLSDENDERTKAVCSFSSGQIKFFSSIDDLTKKLSADFSDLEKQDLQHNSLVKLFTMGIPFTADSMAHYIEKEKEEICELLLNAGMSVNAKTSDGVPLLSVAVRNDMSDKVKWLLSLGADINAISGDRGYSAVMDAVWRKNYDLTKYLIEKGASLEFISSDGQPILVLAVGNGNVDIVNLLLQNGADPDVQDSMGMSARQYANLFKKPGMVEAMEKFPRK